MPAEGFHRRAVNRKHITVRSEPIGLLSVFLLVLLGVAVIEHLHLDAAQEWHGGRGAWRAPGVKAGITPLFLMPPVHLPDDILVLSGGAQPAPRPGPANGDFLAHR